MKEVPSAASAELPVLDKYSGERLGTVPVATREQVHAAALRARAAFGELAAWPAHRRADVLRRTASGIEAREDELARLVSREAGKAWKYSLGEVARAVETFGFAAEEARRIHGETIPFDASPSGEGRFGFYLRSPVGVVGAITPFNFPLNLVAHKVAPALAAGCPVVLKPAEKTPLSAVALGEILAEAGLPPGALEIVHGEGPTVGEWLVRDEIPAKISFTGSPPVGRRILEVAGLKRVTLELGNNSGVILEPDADLTEAVPRCVTSSFANSGQVCLSLQRLYVHRSIASELKRRLVDATRALVVGDPVDPACDVGPMISEEAADRAERWLKEALDGGARLLTGGHRQGRVFEPTVITDVRPDMKVVCREVFAPIVSIIEYERFGEALDMLADSAYGLQAGIYTRDIGKALTAVRRLDVGGVMINDTPIFRVDHMPYGGNRGSGIGREGVRFAIEGMTNLKTVCIRS